MAKKVNVKMEAKMALSAQIAEALELAGVVVESGDNYGFTAGTLVIKGEKTDVQVKLITPKSGVDTYMALEDEVEDSVEGEDVAEEAPVE